MVLCFNHIVRAHRSHRWGRWFESNCHHSLPSSGGLFFSLFSFWHICPRNRPPAKSRQNPCAPTFSSSQGPHTSQRRGNAGRANNSAMRQDLSIIVDLHTLEAIAVNRLPIHEGKKLLRERFTCDLPGLTLHF